MGGASSLVSTQQSVENDQCQVTALGSDWWMARPLADICLSLVLHFDAEDFKTRAVTSDGCDLLTES